MDNPVFKKVQLKQDRGVRSERQRLLAHYFGDKITPSSSEEDIKHLIDPSPRDSPIEGLKPDVGNLQNHEVEVYGTIPSQDSRTQKIKNDTNQAIAAVQVVIDRIIVRGDNLNTLQRAANTLTTSSSMFRRTAHEEFAPANRRWAGTHCLFTVLMACFLFPPLFYGFIKVLFPDGI